MSDPDDYQMFPVQSAQGRRASGARGLKGPLAFSHPFLSGLATSFRK